MVVAEVGWVVVVVGEVGTVVVVFDGGGVVVNGGGVFGPPGQ
jgi:hypothetical protein